MSEPSPRPEKADALIDAYFDDVLTDEQAAQFEAWLLASPDNAVIFAKRAEEHQHLRKLFSGDRVFYLAERIGAAQEDGTFSIEQLALLEDRSEDTPLVDLTERFDRERQEKERRRRRLDLAKPGDPRRRVIVIPAPAVWLAAAAVLGLALWVGMQWGKDRAEAPDFAEVLPPAPQFPAPVATPPAPARLLATHRARWSADGDSIGSDGAVMPGEYHLEAGYAHFAMADGATVIVHAPATFGVRTGGRVTVLNGTLSAYVPEGAEGFVVDTPAGRVLDLGTEFAVAVADEESVEVHVMTGRVVASLPNEGPTRTLNAGDAGRMGLSVAAIEPVPVDAQRFARDWAQVERSVRVEGSARYLYDTPGSVQPAALEHNQTLFLIPEKRGVRLPADTVACDFTQPGRYDRLSVEVEAAPGGVVVDSYLLHYDRVGTPDELDLAYAEGVVHFDRPIVAVIAGNNRLYASDALFQKAGTAYPDAASVVGRGFEGFNHSGFVQDIIEISEDRRTLTARLGASINIDHIRVLVQADPAQEPRGSNQPSSEAGVLLGSSPINSTED